MLGLLGQEVGEDAEDHCRIQELQDPDGQVNEAKNDTSDSHRAVMCADRVRYRVDEVRGVF